MEAVLYGEAPPCAVARREIVRRAGASVRRLHDAGVPHPDLHPKNLLVAPDGRVLVIDLDRARPADGLLPEETRLENLVRLGRSIEKHRLRGMRVGRRDALRFLTGYAGSRAAAEAWLERVRARLARGLRLRAAWWRLIGETKPWQPPSHEPT
jgi:tRNA A-37 threonylcarbamoyl transferase component Bud32